MQIDDRVYVPSRRRSYNVEFKNPRIICLVIHRSRICYLTEAVYEAYWLRNLYLELGLLQEGLPTVIKGDDNEGSLSMVRNPQYHKWLKHIDLWWHWICKLICDRVVTVESVCNLEQTADVLTKALSWEKHQKHTKGMGLISIWGGVL